MPADEALARSLNVSAVLALRKYGVPKFYDLLKRMGLTTLHRPADHYGLSLILGGTEGTLWDVANAYAQLAYTVTDYNQDRKYYQHGAFQTMLDPEPGARGSGNGAAVPGDDAVKQGKDRASDTWEVNDLLVCRRLVTLKALTNVNRPEELIELVPSVRRWPGKPVPVTVFAMDGRSVSPRAISSPYGQATQVARGVLALRGPYWPGSCLICLTYFVTGWFDCPYGELVEAGRLP